MALDGKITDPEVVQGLLDKISAADEAKNRGRLKSCQNILRAFIRLVEAQVGKCMDASSANLLITDAQYIINNL